MTILKCYESRLSPEYEQEYLAKKRRAREYYKWLNSPNTHSVLETYATLMSFNEEQVQDWVMGDDFLYYEDKH